MGMSSTEGPPHKHMRDRRRYKRFSVIAYVREKPDSTSRFYFIQDVSEAGALLIADSKPPLGAMITLNISVRFISSTIDVEAKVVRHDERGFAVVFEKISGESAKRLRHYLYSSKKERIRAAFKARSQ